MMLLATKQGRQEGNRPEFPPNTRLYLFDQVEELALEHSLGAKEVIKGNWDQFA